MKSTDVHFGHLKKVDPSAPSHRGKGLQEGILLKILKLTLHFLHSGAHDKYQVCANLYLSLVSFWGYPLKVEHICI